MWALIGNLVSSVSGLLALMAVVVGLIGVGAYEQHKVDTASLLKVEQGYQAAELKAAQEAAVKQKAYDDDALAAAQAEAQKNAAQVATLQQEIASVQVHVSPVVKNIPCIPLGLVRVLDAAILGVDANSLALPAGKSGGSCSTLSATDLATALVKDFGAARHNAQQLNDLIALLKQEGFQEKH